MTEIWNKFKTDFPNADLTRFSQKNWFGEYGNI